MSYSCISIRETSGDSILTKDLKIVTTNTNASGDISIKEICPGVRNTYYRSLQGPDLEVNSGYRTGVSPYYFNMNGDGFGMGSKSSFDRDFGNFTLRPGVNMVADEYNNSIGGKWNSSKGEYESSSYNCQTTGMQSMFADWENISQGDQVNIKMIHIPSQTVIFSSDVEVV